MHHGHETISGQESRMNQGFASMHDGWIFASDGPMVGWMNRSDDVWTDSRMDEGITGE